MLYFIKEQFLKPVSRITGIVLMVCWCYHAGAQVFYSTNPNYLKVKTEKNNLTSRYKDTYPDTAVTALNNFTPRNFMGNIGLPAPDYFLKYGTSDLGFRFFNAPTAGDRFLENQVEYYRTKGPYANLTGVAGSKLLQMFKMSFTHTYKDKFNFTLKFNRYSSQGFYLKQQSYVNNFYLSSNYTSKTKRSGYYFFVLSNSNKSQENGGIRDGRLTDSTVGLSKALLPVRLTDATRDNRETKIMINPWLRLNRIGDSLHGLNHYLQFKSRLNLNAYKYKDTKLGDGGYYTNFYLDTIQTTDSSHVRQITNELSYALMSRDERLAFSAGYKNEMSRIWQKQNHTYTNHLLNADLSYHLPLSTGDSSGKARYLETHFNASYVLAGFNSGNYKLENNSAYVLDERKGRAFFLNILYEKRSPDYIYNNWTSNHFLWAANGYKAQEQAQLQAGLRSGRNFTARVFYGTVNNYLYFDASAFPHQYQPFIQNLGASVDYTKTAWKHLGFLLSYTFQQSSNSALVRMPQNSGTAKLFYNGNLFKNNLQLQIGAQLQLYQSFTAYGYMPSTQVFYLQNTFNTASYPFLDVYLNARIRPVAFFLKVENVLSKAGAGNNYAFVPGYYQADLAFRFGISWTFFD